MQKAYFLVAKQFIQAMYPSCQYTQQSIISHAMTSDVLGNDVVRLKSTGKVLVDPGWRSAFDSGLNSFHGIPSIEKGQSLSVKSTKITAAKTQPPKRFTETTLPKEMETVGKMITDPKYRKLLKNSEGIGTPATRKTIIDTLMARDYVCVKKGAYHSTQKGKDLIKAVPTWLSSPEQTAIWEDYLLKICETKIDDESVSMRDNFVNRQISKVEEEITALNTNLYDSVQGKDRHKSTPKKVTDKMKSVIKSICEKQNIAPPKGVMSDPAKAKHFLDEQINILSKPSEKQLAIVNNIVQGLPENERIDDAVFTDKKACSKFIEQHAHLLKPRKPSEKQIALVTRLIESKGIKDIDPSIFENSKLCSDFITEHGSSMPATAPSQKQIGLIERLAASANDKDKPGEDVFKDSRKASAYISKMLGKK